MRLPFPIAPNHEASGDAIYAFQVLYCLGLTEEAHFWSVVQRHEALSADEKSKVVVLRTILECGAYVHSIQPLEPQLAIGDPRHLQFAVQQLHLNDALSKALIDEMTPDLHERMRLRLAYVEPYAGTQYTHECRRGTRGDIVRALHAGRVIGATHRELGSTIILPTEGGCTLYFPDSGHFMNSNPDWAEFATFPLYSVYSATPFA